MTRIVFISDTHNQLSDVDVPEGDLLIHCGDWTMGGRAEELTKFNYDMGNLKSKFKLGLVAIAGNHDRMLEMDPLLDEVFSPILRIYRMIWLRLVDSRLWKSMDPPFWVRLGVSN